MINIIEENIINATQDIIGHQVNCYGIMGSGVAYYIKKSFPKAFCDYREKCIKFTNHKKLLLGTNQYVKINNKIVCNMFGQCEFGTHKQFTSLSALFLCLRTLFYKAQQDNLSVALPYKIGCGRGGADWDVVYNYIKILNEEFNIDIYLYKYEK